MADLSLPTSHGDHPPLLVGTLLELRRLERSARLSTAAMEEIQLDRLRRMVGHAQRTVPMYSRLYPDGVAGRLHSMNDLSCLPIIDRSIVVEVPPEERRAGPPPERTRRHASSGSSGHPVISEVTPGPSWWRGLLWMRRRRSQGLQPWLRQVTLRRHAQEDRTSPLWRLTGQRVSVLDPTLSPSELAGELRARRPQVLVGNAHVLVTIGEAIDEPLPLRGIVTGGTVLTPEDREAITRSFGLSPFDVYGLVEQGPVAGQCRARDLYHVDHESVIAEVLDDDDRPVPDGTSGSLVLSGLWNPHMPFLRYRTGDRATFATRPCRCGHQLRSIESVDGRALDWFIDGRGARIAPQRLFISYRVPEEPCVRWLRRYRVCQDADGAVTVEILPRPGLPDSFLRQVERGYRELLGAGVSVRCIVVDDLPTDSSGKFRQFVSERGRSTGAGSGRSPQ